MPTGTPFNSCVLPYNIRVDDFASSAALEELGTIPALHLLTHTHSDHINGLSAKSFGHTVYCSQDAKEMLLRHEVYAEREFHQLELRAEKVRTYSHLKVDPLLFPDGTMYYTGSRDLLKPLPLHTPTKIDISGNEAVTITLLDANHCPGAVMFLIEGPRGAILHTGDCRAEPWFLESIIRNPFLQPYLYPGSDVGPSKVSMTLEAIYLDTACVLSPVNVPTKESATLGLLELMNLCPSSVYFFINSWTWGYEDVLKAIAQSFQSKIHVDRYKYSIYQHISDPFLRLITTRDPSSTRFHACERFHRCEYVMVDNEEHNYSNAISHMGKRVIYVNPVTMGNVSWELYLRDTKARLKAGEEINNLLVPLSRHSPLPELQAFVSLFRPRRVVPNTLDPRLHGLDWACIDRMFADYIHPSTQLASDSGRIITALSNQLPPQLQDDGDVALKNLVGCGAVDAAARWADGGKLLKKFDVVRRYLGAEENAVIDRLLGVKNPAFAARAVNTLIKQDKGKGKATVSRYGRESDGDTDFSDSDDEKGRTAHLLFASLAGIEEKENAWWVTSSPSQRVSDVDVLHEQPVAGPSSVASPSWRTSGNSGEAQGGDAVWRKNRLLTPVTSPIRARVTKLSPLQMNVKPLQLTPSPPTPRRLGKRNSIGTAQGYTLSSPIYILSSSPPAIRSSHGGKGLGASAASVDKPRPSSSTRSLLTKTNSQIIDRQGHAVETTPIMKKSAHKASRVEPKPISHSPFSTPKRAVNPTVSSSNQPTTSRADPKTPTKSARKRVAHELPMEAVVDLKRPRHDPPKPKPSPPKAKGSASSSKKKAARGAPTSTRTPLPLSPVKVSTSKRQRSELQLQRIQIGERLARARPDLNAPTYEKKRASLMARYSTMEVVEEQQGKVKERPSSPTPTPRGVAQEKTILSFETVDDDDGGMDWNRSRELAAALKADIANGRRPVLPALLCAESQSQEWESDG